MAHLNDVSIEDCGRLQGAQINQLEAAVKFACPGQDGDAIWAVIFSRYELGVGDSGEKWVLNMNRAIGIWNRSKPKNRDEVIKAFGVEL